MSGKTVGRHRVQWCNDAIQWTAVAADDEFSPWDRNAMWSYDLGGLTYFGFPFDPDRKSVV